MTNPVRMAWGDESPIQFAVLDEDGAAVDITGLTLCFQIRLSEGVRSAPALISKSTDEVTEIALTTPASGRGEVYMVAADWALLEEGVSYFCALWLVDANGRTRPVIASTPFIVELTPFAQADI